MISKIISLLLILLIFFSKVSTTASKMITFWKTSSTSTSKTWPEQISTRHETKREKKWWFQKTWCNLFKKHLLRIFLFSPKTAFSVKKIILSLALMLCNAFELAANSFFLSKLKYLSTELANTEQGDSSSDQTFSLLNFQLQVRL